MHVMPNDQRFVKQVLFESNETPPAVKQALLFLLPEFDFEHPAVLEFESWQTDPAARQFAEQVATAAMQLGNPKRPSDFARRMQQKGLSVYINGFASQRILASNSGHPEWMVVISTKPLTQANLNSDLVPAKFISVDNRVWAQILAIQAPLPKDGPHTPPMRQPISPTLVAA